jgi:hypothetical protein
VPQYFPADLELIILGSIFNVATVFKPQRQCIRTYFKQRVLGPSPLGRFVTGQSAVAWPARNDSRLSKTDVANSLRLSKTDVASSLSDPGLEMGKWEGIKFVNAFTVL